MVHFSDMVRVVVVVVVVAAAAAAAAAGEYFVCWTRRCSWWSSVDTDWVGSSSQDIFGVVEMVVDGGWGCYQVLVVRC